MSDWERPSDNDRVQSMTPPTNDGAEQSGVEYDKPQETEDTLRAQDPEDYHKRKKLERINRVKERVGQLRRNRGETILKFSDRTAKRLSGQEVYRVEVANAVATYGSELLPIIEDALEDGTLVESDLNARTFRDNKIDIRDFIEYNGVAGGPSPGETDCATVDKSMQVYRQLERIERRLGLGVSLEEDRGPAQI